MEAEARSAAGLGTPRVEVRSVSRTFGEVVALAEVSITVAPGEFVTLLGPSGCGKTTLLRIIAGFDRPSSGSVWIDGDDVTGRSAHRRPVNMVFQRPTLFPHLDVAGNVSFGPRIAKTPSAERARLVDEALAVVRLDGYQRRRATELSGGQMQRVALARAIVNRPKVLLLDEPLSALDLAIRLEMEEELRRLHRELGATFVYVTHDQREALALSDRIMVFSSGRIEQVGTPDEIYARPASPFVARLVGDANVVPAQADARSVVVAGSRLVSPDSDVRGLAWAVIRPEHITLAPSAPGHTGLSGTVVDLAYRGTGHAYRVQLDDGSTTLKAETVGGPAIGVGTRVDLTVAENSIHLLAREGDLEQVPSTEPGSGHAP